ncbi:MAG TPA: ribosome recycling factor [Candidatus Ratteibacteria bacterium]|nr:ribosome recycling factor [Candidatus Ratteibacteria bacterium]
MKNQIVKEVDNKMKEVVNFFTKEIGLLRVGRASVSLLEGIIVEYYGSKMPINQLSTITIPQPQLLIIQPWDKNIVGDMVKAIQASNIGLNPISDGNVIRIPVPPLSEESRKEIVKNLYKMAEEAKVEIREIRRQANIQLKEKQKNGEISEDDMYNGFDEIQKMTDKYIEEIDKKTKDKEKEIMEL